MELIIKPLKLDRIDEAYKFLNEYSNDLGFIIKNSISDAIKRNDSVFIEEEGAIVALCNFNRRKDKVVIIYEIAVSSSVRGKGYGREIIKYLLNIFGRVLLKCPVDNESNKFYEKVGGKILKVEKGKKRMLNVWLLTRSNFK